MVYRLLHPDVDTMQYVLQLREKAQALLLEGKTIMTWAGEGSSVEKKFTIPIAVVLEETKAFIRDFNGTYPVTSVRPFFS